MLLILCLWSPFLQSRGSSILVFKQETKYEFVKVLYANFHMSAGVMFLITFQVKDPADDLTKDFQARIRYSFVDESNFVFCRPRRYSLFSIYWAGFGMDHYIGYSSIWNYYVSSVLTSSSFYLILDCFGRFDPRRWRWTLRENCHETNLYYLSRHGCIVSLMFNVRI